MPKVLISIKVEPALLAQLRKHAKAVGSTVTGVLEAGASWAMASGWTPGTVARLPIVVEPGVFEVPPPPVKRPKAFTRAAPKEPATTDHCRRCRHPKHSHWTRGCLSGCPCSEQRYQKP